ncbi:diaminopimelate decarboxylase [Thermodesulfobacteriota bacterium]
MHHYHYQNGTLHCESVALPEIAHQVDTPFYLYSKETLVRHFKAFDDAFQEIPHITCFATKACSNIAILSLFSSLGGGADIVSGGELFRALKAGMDPKKIVYSGVGKTAAEFRFALEAGILLFNIESTQELDLLQEVAAELKTTAPIAFRVNPDVDPKTHAYISTGLAKNKFGIPITEALEVYQKAALLPNIEIKGISCHIGSQLTDISPFVDSLRKLKEFLNRLRDAAIHIAYLDLGGGLGITYDDEAPPHPEEYARAIKQEMEGLDCTLILEPGRVIVGNAGILVTKVLYTKTGQKNFVIVDAAMNDLARPSLYGAFHAIQAVRQNDRGTVLADIVGPICETGDFLAKDQAIPIFAQGDLVAVMSSGAYGFTMSSNYNSRPRAPEVLVHGSDFSIIRQRETYDTLIQGEMIPEIFTK